MSCSVPFVQALDTAEYGFMMGLLSVQPLGGCAHDPAVLVAFALFDRS
jgi:hypothetical protein